MKIQINTDNHITNNQAFTKEIQEIVESKCEYFLDRLSRIEVYFKDENSSKAGEDDKKCLIEARVEGMKPMAVNHHAATLRLAASGASEKLERLLKTNLGKLQ